ncbi:hypothetical protein CHLNCDRAFT_139580 [Chlorella variabilis]|uniref:Uncharacterized protein n=1 Tax=Chlorella variabilis TaxID=554065 RepID=E1ZQG5_CHLVA|nr:hypothetical protein CHLNCDRAFT_139580 [Chlorella variabilis]EFN51929.1 hypothetical protein CHLNCDRAFT_139580 [Chlorella variabilis]|eukprot:XP_005844031.1 hypothetical protein CHLNCDRAFT_139580 [Chlorella variabilis]
MQACPASLGAASGLPSSLRWGAERGPAQRAGFPGQGPLPRRRRRQASDLACRTVEHHGGRAAGGLHGVEPGAAEADVFGANGAAAAAGHGHAGPPPPAAAARPSLPTETFKQLRHAVLTSLDIADNAEHTVDYEDGSAEVQEDILLESCPSAKEVGKSVFETLRIDQAGKTRRVYVRRRDLIRAHGLQPRDLRRVDPSLSPTKVSPSVTIKEECVLLNIGGVRAVVTEDKSCAA